MEYEQAASCVIVNVRPATVTVPDRLVDTVLAATATVTVPAPVPLAPAVTVSQAALLVDVQVHPLPAETDVLVDCAEAPTERLVGEIEYEQAAACVTVNVWPATVSVPVRAVVAVLAAALKETVPLPEPLAPLVTASQEALLTAVHAQPVPAVTFTVPVPPAAGTDADVAESAGAHGGE
jgi:hypothetical protein